VLWGLGDGTFQGQLNCGTGDIPYSVVAGDFNNDGKTDLIVANSGANSVSVILNHWNESFQARADYPAGPNPYSVATSDFNGDGFLDLAVANSNCPIFPDCGAGTISILAGNGDGTFRAPSQYSTGTKTDPYAVVVGDFNGDKIADLAVANYATNTVGVLLGVGNGTFMAHVDFPVGSEPASLATGDFNADGKLDLVVANFHGNTVSVLLGNGDGTFKAAENYSVGNGPVSVAVGDFNGDRKLDLVVVNETDNNASVLLGNGDGTFQAQVAYPTGVGGNPLSVVVGDFNGDHNLDLAVADFQTQQVSVLLGNGDGTFQPVKAYSTGANPSSIAIADFNGDGKLDLALTSTPLGSSPGNMVSLLLGNGDGTFGSPALFGTGSEAYSAAVGDFNGDGATDLAVANGISNTVSVLLNTQGTAMTLVSSSNPSAFGQSVTFTTTVVASVSNGTAAPTGTVTLKKGSTVLGSGALVNQEFSLSTTTLPVGADVLSAVYSGDGNYQSRTVGLTQTVTMAGTSTVLISSANPSNSNESITFTATVTSNTTGEPTGNVTFLDGTSTLGAASVNGSGIATFSISTLSVGTHSITAAYGGGSNFRASTSPELSQVVQGNTSTALSSAANPSTESQSVTFTAAVSSGGGIVPTGTVKFMDGTTELGSSALNGSAIATFSFGKLSVGTHSITAIYGGDTNSDPSTSPVLSQVVQKASTSAALSSAPTLPNLNQSVTFTATITSEAAGIPTGTVNFMDGTKQIGSSDLNASAVATLSTSTLAAGAHHITAAYGGDGNFNASTSATESLEVTAPDFSLSATALSPPSVAPGASAKSTITINPSGGLNPSTVTLVCSVSPVMSPAANCSLGTVSVTNNTGTATLTVATSGPEALLVPPVGEHGSQTRLALALMIPGMLLFGGGVHKLNRRRLLSFCLIFLVLGGCLFQVACGGGSNTPATGGKPGTPANSYTVTITGNAIGTPQHTASVLLTVQ
jgi:hypothetical protein